MIGEIKYSINKPKSPKKIWKFDYNPYREVVLWGFDKNNQPSFMVLYGKHQFTKKSEDKDVKELLEDVEYTSYLILSGKNNHLPSFEEVQIVEEPEYRNRDKADEYPKLYYIRGERSYYYSEKDEDIVEGYYKIDSSNYVKLPYFKDLSHKEIIDAIEGNKKLLGIFNVKNETHDYNGFKFVNSPNDILNVNDSISEYYDILCVLFSDKKLYTRKKSLNIILDSNPPKEVIELILKVGNSQVISGLFLELAKRKKADFIYVAKEMCEKGVDWASPSFARGVIRCAKIYINSFDEKLLAERKEHIRANLKDIDLNLISVRNKKVEDGEIFDGKKYRRFYYSGVYSKYEYKYERGDDGRYHSIKYDRDPYFNVNEYSDGYDINIVALKNTIQEAAYYDMADVIGKIAYYLDAPRLTYYFMAVGKGHIHRYFKRYIRRIVDDYSKYNEKLYIESLKALFTSYTEKDYLCKYSGNFQFNYFIKQYLYYDFKEKPPVGWDNWQERHEFMSHDQLMKLEGRYEYNKELFDKYIEEVLYIAINSKVEVITKACYYAIKDNNNLQKILDKLSFDKIISCCNNKYEPLALLFIDILSEKLDRINNFDSQIMMMLINSDNEKVNELANKYFNNTNGKFSVEDTVKLLNLDNLNKNIQVFENCVLNMSSNEYLTFIKSIITSGNDIKLKDEEILKTVEDILDISTNKVKDFNESEEKEVIDFIYSQIICSDKKLKYLEMYMEKVIFSANYEHLKQLVKNKNLSDEAIILSQRGNEIMCVLKSLKNNQLMENYEITEILQNGTSKIVNVLINFIDENKNMLSDKFKTILLLLECEVDALNVIAKEVFEYMESERRLECLKIILDSPIDRVYKYALEWIKELYGDNIPKEFIIQMLEHSSLEVKAFISDKCYSALQDFSNPDLFMYYAKTLLLAPNKAARSKVDVYKCLVGFAKYNKEKISEIEKLLLLVGGSNIIKDSENALVTLMQIRKEGLVYEG